MIAGRFELAQARGDYPRGTDRQTKQPCIAYSLSPPALDRVGLRTVARWDLGARDARIARSLWPNPAIVQTGTDRSASTQEVALAAFALLELAISLAPYGVSPWFRFAWIPSDAPVRVPILPAHFFASGTRIDDLGEIVVWAAQRGLYTTGRGLTAQAMGDHFAAHAAGAIARERLALPTTLARRSLAIDFDEAIAEAEKDLAAHGGAAAVPLAGALHHRACVRFAAGDPRALDDAARAVSLDGRGVYWTTKALIEERAGSDEAVRSHDAALRALGVDTGVADPFAAPPALAFDPCAAGRALLARGVDRAKRGDRAGARADIEASLGRSPSPTAERWLARLA